MTYMLPGEVRCRECGLIGFPGAAERWAAPGEQADDYLHGRAIAWDDCCDACGSRDISSKPACVHCGLRDATDEDYCHTCAVAIETTDVLCASRAGIERIDDLHQTIRDITLAQAVSR